jgi:hypothetical protein
MSDIASKIAPPIIRPRFDQLDRGAKFLVFPLPPTTVEGTYTAATPAMVWMKLQAEPGVTFNAVNLNTGMLSTFLADTAVIPIGLAP